MRCGRWSTSSTSSALRVSHRRRSGFGDDAVADQQSAVRFVKIAFAVGQARRGAMKGEQASPEKCGGHFVAPAELAALSYQATRSLRSSGVMPDTFPRHGVATPCLDIDLAGMRCDIRNRFEFFTCLGAKRMPSQAGSAAWHMPQRPCTISFGLTEMRIAGKALLNRRQRDGLLPGQHFGTVEST